MNRRPAGAAHKTQANSPIIGTHAGTAPEHIRPQAPQFDTVDRSVSQPLTGSWSQSAQFGSQPFMNVQTPAVQFTVSPLTWGSAVQSTQARPQKLTSRSVA